MATKTTTTCLQLQKDLYKRFKQKCKENFSSVTKAFNLFMKSELEKEEKEKCI